MLRATSLAFVLVASLSAVPISSAQSVHIPIPPAVPQAQDLHTPIDAIKKAEQIEKLARSVKSKMKQAF